MSAIKPALKHLLESGFREDIGSGDLTSASLPQGNIVSGNFIAKSDGILAGTGAITEGYKLLDDSIAVKLLKTDGDSVAKGDLIATIKGPVQAILSGERTILNILQHLSGIATQTSAAVKNLEGSDTRVCDTRKTLPGWRVLQKYAVRCGGGFNHRMRLDDGIMIKENHIAAAGSITEAVKLVKKSAGLMVKTEVECETAGQVTEAVTAGAEIIMLDNKTPQEAKELCKQIPDSVIVELSGGITADTIGSYKECGADYISMGSLTHSVKAFDISFTLEGSIKS